MEKTKTKRTYTRKSYEELELRDDFMFGKVMSNPKLCKAVIETLLNIKIDTLQYLQEQKTIDATVEGRGIRLDLYVQDRQGTVYDAEMQQKSNAKRNKELPERSRYYQGMIDHEMLDKNDDFGDLPKTYIIFICTFDPFGKGYCCYTFENMCREEPTLKLNDGSVKVFFNTEGMDDYTSKDRKELLNYIKDGSIHTPLTQKLDKEVQMVRRNGKWRDEYMKTKIYVDEIWREGREEGIEEGIEQEREHLLLVMVADALEDGLPEEKIYGKLTKRYGLSEEEAHRLYESAALACKK